MTARTACLVLSPLVLYLLALNPYFMPDVSDCLGYYYGARSIAEHGSYDFDGQPVDAWPPGFPIILALPFLFGFTSVLTAKLTVVAMAALGMLMTFLLLSRERYRYAAIATVFAWTLPEVMRSGSSIMSEIPFLTLSVVFLFLLNLQREQERGVPFAVLAGFMLGWASLTRWIGILLGAAVIAQAIIQLRNRRGKPLWKRCLPEVFTGAIGGALYLGWCVFFIGSVDRMQFIGDWNRFEPQLAETEARRLAGGESPWLQWEPWRLEEGGKNKPGKAGTLRSTPRPLRVPDVVSDFLFQYRSFLRLAGFPAKHPLRYLFMIPLVAIVAGFVHRFHSGRGSPPDWYVLAMVVALALMPWSPLRFWVPLAPFLMVYFIEGGDLLWRCLTRRLDFPGKSRAPALAMGVYFLILLALAGDRLFRPNYPHGGLCFLVSQSPEKFYLRFWGDLYSSCEAIRRDAEGARTGAEGVVVFAGRTEPERGFAGVYDYAEHFTGRKVRNYPAITPAAYMLVRNPLEVPASLVEDLDLTLLAETPSFKSYRVGSRR